MRKRNETKVRTVWNSKPTEFPWGTRDLGQRVTVNETTDNVVLLTEEDLKYMPTQEQLTELTFVAYPDVYDKLYKPFYMLRKVEKNKVVETKLMLQKLN